MPQTVYHCSIAMPLETLSAWYDHELTNMEAERVQEHIKACLACQEQLANYATTKRVINQFDAPQLQSNIWHGLQQRDAPKQRGTGIPRGVILSGLGAALVIVIVFAAFTVIGMDNHGRSISAIPTTNPTSTSTLVPTPTIATLKVAPGQNWTNVPAVSFGKGIAFAQSDPLTGYVCGSQEPENTLPISLSTTHDGGLTWSSPHATPITFSNCSIYINPSNSQDLVVHGTNTWGPVGDGIEYEYGTYFRSIDGGQSWAALILPGNSTGNGQLGDVVITQVAWAGSTLFASTHIASQQDVGMPQHLLAKSINNGPLQWADQTLPFPRSQSGNGDISAIFGLGQTIYTESSCNSVESCFVATSGDAGVSWSKFNLPVGVYITAVGGDGKTLLSNSNVDNVVRISTDGGHSWTPLTPSPYSADAVIMIPDGTIYRFALVGGIEKIFKLMPGSTSWTSTGITNTATMIRFLTTETLSWDTSGHPIACWRVHLTGDNLPGIEYHAP